MGEGIPKQYEYLKHEGAPRILVEALKLHGTQEFIGEKNNPEILMWAREIRDHVGLEYKADETPWCGLFMGVVCKRAGFEPPFLCIRAKEWAKWGRSKRVAELGDVLVKERKGGGHVCMYVGEDEWYYHALGGNQGDAVNIRKIKKDSILAIRECPWQFSRPANVRRIFVGNGGIIGGNEA